MALSTTAGIIAPFPKHQFLDENGDPYNGGLLFTYAPGTTTKKATYTDEALTVANANPIVLDSAGRATIFLVPTESYKFVLAPSTDTDPPASAIWTVDSVSALSGGVAGIQVAGTAGEALSTGNVCYVSDGSGSLTAGRWYKADADLVYASTRTGMLGVATTAISSGSTGSFIIGGRLTGGSGFTAGDVYYVSSTAGAVTNTRPQEGRVFAVADSTTSLVMAPSDGLSGLNRYEDSVISTTGNSGAGEDVLDSHTLTAAKITANGEAILVRYFGGTTNNANAKTLRLRAIEGANNNLLLSAALQVNEAGNWGLWALILRNAATTYISYGHVNSGPGSAADTVNIGDTTNGTLTWANAVEIRLTGEATTDNDITVNGGLVTTVTI